jgi:hypothetical protein
MTARFSYIGEILDVAFEAAQAVVVLLTRMMKHDFARAHISDDPPDEREFRSGKTERFV